MIEMLEHIHAERDDYRTFINKVKKGDDGVRLMGFGHRVYKNFDPRAKLLKSACDRIFERARDPRSAARPGEEHRRSGAERRLFRLAQALSQRRLLQRHHLSRDGHSDRDVHGDVHARPPSGLDRALARAKKRPGRLPHPPPAPDLYRRADPPVRGPGHQAALATELGVFTVAQSGCRSSRPGVATIRWRKRLCAATKRAKRARAQAKPSSVGGLGG